MITGRRKPQVYELTAEETVAHRAAQAADYELRAPNTTALFKQLGEKYGFEWMTVYDTGLLDKLSATPSDAETDGDAA